MIPTGIPGIPHRARPAFKRDRFTRASWKGWSAVICWGRWSLVFCYDIRMLVLGAYVLAGSRGYRYALLGAGVVSVSLGCLWRDDTDTGTL